MMKNKTRSRSLTASRSLALTLSPVWGTDSAGSEVSVRMVRYGGFLTAVEKHRGV